MIRQKIQHIRNGDRTDIIYIDPGHIREMDKLGGWMENEMLESIAEMGITGTYIDIGAHIGNHSIFFAKYCPTSMVVSYEAIPEIYDVLEENIEPYKGRIKIWNQGIAPQLSFYKPELNENRPAQSRININGKYSKNMMLMPLRITSTVGLIKIDVEGGEHDVVRGCMEVIERDKPHLFIETFNDVKWIMNLLPEGYKKVRRYNTAPTYHFKHRDHG